jgi:predicted porin
MLIIHPTSFAKFFTAEGHTGAEFPRHLKNSEDRLNKKLIAAAVAGALAAPGVALAQSSVTISGQLKVAVQNIHITNVNAARTGNTSENRFVDDGPSRITFSMREDLGGGLAAVGQIELRHTVDGNTSFDATGVGSSAGNMFVGLQSNSWGLLRLGSVDRHYTLSGDTFAATAPGFTGSVHVGSASIGGVSTTIAAGGTRTRNSIGWDSPNWSGFTLSTGWSFRQVSGQEGDLVNVPTTTLALAGAAAGTKPRKGNAWWLTGRYDASNWFIGLSYMNDKTEAGASNNASSSFTAVTCTTATPPVCTTTSTTTYVGMRDHRQWRFAARYNFPGGVGLGFTYDRSRASAASTIGGGDVYNRTAWAVPLDYTTGPHSFGVLYSRAGDDKVQAENQKSRSWSLRYVYALSKRTSMGIGYLRLNNADSAAYAVSGDNTTTANAYSSSNAALRAGEKARVIGANMRHAF